MPHSLCLARAFVWNVCVLDIYLLHKALRLTHKWNATSITGSHCTDCSLSGLPVVNVGERWKASAIAAGIMSSKYTVGSSQSLHIHFNKLFIKFLPFENLSNDY